MKKILLPCFIVCSILFGGAFLFSFNGVERFIGLFIEDRYKTLFLSKIRDFNNYFYLVQIFLASASLLSGAAVFYIDQIIDFLTTLYQGLRTEVKSLTKNLSNLTKIQKKWCLCAMMGYVLAKFVALCMFPIQLDEAFSTVYFWDRGFWACLLYFPGPNNHFLFSVLNYPFYILFRSLYVARALSMLFQFVLLALLFETSLKYFSFAKSLLSVLLLACLPYFFIYGILARGYALQMLIAFLLFKLVYLIYKNRLPHFGFFFTLLAACGFYTNPAFLYVYVSILTFWGIVFLIFRPMQILYSFILMIAISSLATICVYTPIVLLNGMQNVLYNSWFARMDADALHSQMMIYWVDVCNSLLLEQYGFYLFMLLLFSSIIYASLRKEVVFLCFVFSFLLMPIFMVYIQGVLPPVRIWTYLTLVIDYVLIYSTSFFKKMETAVLIVLTAVVIANTVLELNTIIQTVNQPLQTAEALLLRGKTNIYCTSDDENVFCRYVYSQAKKPIYINTLDAVTDYDAWIVDKEKDNIGIPPNFVLLRKYGKIEVWTKR